MKVEKIPLMHKDLKSLNILLAGKLTSLQDHVLCKIVSRITLRNVRISKLHDLEEKHEKSLDTNLYFLCELY